MSDLSKNLLRKKASAFGLESISESATASPAPQDLNSDEVKENKELLEATESLRDKVFPVSEIYENPQSGLLISTHYRPPGGDSAPIFVCHHGAGSSGMTFWCMTRYMAKNWVGVQSPGVFVFDARGHGDSSCPEPLDYTLETLTTDFKFIFDEFLRRNNIKNTICLMGHSLGGSVLTNFVDRETSSDYHIKGLVVVDIVEETAVRALLSVSSFLSRRPKSFKTYSDAIQWHLSSHLLKNEESAKVSVADLLTQSSDNELVWKTDLKDMSHSWDTWFVNLSEKFINCSLPNERVSKLLLLSSNETLDKNLMIGQMQGKYQLVVFNNSANAGHFLQEDIPKQFSMSVMDFVRRNSSGHIESKQVKLKSLWGGHINN